MRTRLVSERKARKWNQQFVASQVGVSLRAYQNYERDRRDPPLTVAFKLEDLFGIRDRELLSREETTA